MVFSNDILKIGKAKIVNGIVGKNILKIYVSKDDNKVFKKTINLKDGAMIKQETNALKFSEVVPVADNFIVARIGTNFKIVKADDEI